MIYCITLIIIVALICATHLYPLLIEHDRKRAEKALELVRKIREENNKLRKDVNDAYDGWLSYFDKRQEEQDKVFDKLYEILEKFDIKL